MLKKVFKLIVKNITKILLSVKTEDIDKVSQSLSKSDKNMFVCNHPSFMDGLILGMFLPCNPVFLVHTTILERKFFKFMLNFVDYLPIESSSPMALKKLASAVNAGRPVVVFPEGRITITGGLMKIYEGSAFIAAKTGANVIPITLQGLLKSKISRMGI